MKKQLFLPVYQQQRQTTSSWVIN